MAIREVNKTTGDTSRIVAGGTLWADSPIGSILPYGGASAPSGWFICNGSAISRTTYSELFAVIGTSFGVGDGSTTFNLPDMRGKTTMGVETGHALGDSENGALPNIKGGNNNNTSISHWTDGSTQGNASAFYEGRPSGYGVATGQLGEFRSLMFDASRISSIYKNNQTKVDPANVRVNYIIKAKMVAVPADFMAKVDEAVEEANEYSTTETVVGKWLDGKPIYRKVLTGSWSTPKDEWYQITYANNFENLIRVGLLTASKQSVCNPISTSYTSSSVSVVMGDTGTFNKIILEYTKA